MPYPARQEVSANTKQRKHPQLCAEGRSLLNFYWLNKVKLFKCLKIQQVHQYKACLFAQRDTNRKRTRSTWPYISCLKPTRIFSHNQNWEHGQEQIFSSWSSAPMAHKTFTKNTTIYHHNRLSKECINYLALCFVCRWIETSAHQQRWLMETTSLPRKRELLWVSHHLQTTATSISK